MENSAFLTNYEGQPTTLATRCAASEHGRAEAELRFQIEMMSHMPGGVAVIRASDGVIVYASQAFVEMFGYDRPEELAGKHISIVNAPGEKSPEAVSKEIKAGLQNEPGVWSGEIRNIRKDGTPFWSFNKISTYEHHEHGKVWISIKTDITERKQTEEDIYRKLYDNAPDMLASVDPSTARIVQCNQTIATALGYTKEELVGRSVLEIYHPDSIERAKEAFWSFVNAGVFRDLELQLERKDGSVIDTSLNVSAIRDEQGNIVYSNLIWHDITRRKQAEVALRESEERFRLATSAGKVGVWDWDVVAKTVTWSDTIYNVHGLEPGEFGGTVEAFAELVHADDRDYVNEAIQRALYDDMPYELEFRAVRPDGGIVWIFTHARVIRDSSGAPVPMLGGLVDITPRKQAEETLRQNEKRYKLVLGGADAAIWDWDVPAKRVLFSPRWKELRGFSDDEVSDHEEEWSSGIHPDDFDRVMASVQAHFEGRTPVFAEEYRVRHKDGRWVWILDRGLALRDAAGQVLRMAGSETDITERKQGEEGRARLAAIVESSDDATISITLDGVVTSWNAAAERIYGYSAEEVLGRSVLMLALPEQETEISQLLEKLQGESGLNISTR